MDKRCGLKDTRDGHVDCSSTGAKPKLELSLGLGKRPYLLTAGLLLILILFTFTVLGSLHMDSSDLTIGNCRVRGNGLKYGTANSTPHCLPYGRWMYEAIVDSYQIGVSWERYTIAKLKC